jgi:hypothetical protein
MKYRYVELHLEDELSRLGSGRRRVIAREAKKWINLWSPFTLWHQRIHRTKWDKIHKQYLEDTEADMAHLVNECCPQDHSIWDNLKRKLVND